MDHILLHIMKKAVWAAKFYRPDKELQAINVLIEAVEMWEGPHLRKFDD